MHRGDRNHAGFTRYQLADALNEHIRPNQSNNAMRFALAQLSDVQRALLFKLLQRSIKRYSDSE